jgi:hypothetical protein
MAAIVLTTIQAQVLTAMETSALGAFGDGVVVPGGNPAVLPPFEGYNDYTNDQKSLGLNALKTTFVPFLLALGAAPSYTNVTFENGYGIWGDARYGQGLMRYTKGVDGYVRVHGLMRTPASGATNVVAFTLPAGFTPSSNDNHIFACVSNDTFCSVEVNFAGQVSVRSVPANDTWVSLEFRFYAGG